LVSRSKHIGVIGGGLIGMLSAYYLAKSGFKVSIFDKSNVGSESTWAGGGILSPLYPWKYAKEINSLAVHSQEVYSKLTQEIQELSGINSEYTRTGLLIDKAEFDPSATHWCQQHLKETAFLDAENETLVNLNTQKKYIFFPEIAQVRNPCLAQSLAKALEKLDVNIFPQTAVSNIIENYDHKIRLQTSNGEKLLDKVVVSAGAWSAKLLASTGLDINIKPIRGQMLLFKANPGFLKSILLAKGHYIIPRRDGRILVGSTMEDVGFDKSVTDLAQNNLKRFIQEYLPGLLEFPIEKHWAGLRPGSPKGIPVIGVHPNMPNVYVNTGHFRNGVVLAPASALLIRDIILNKQSFIDPLNFSVNCAFQRSFEAV